MWLVKPRELLRQIEEYLSWKEKFITSTHAQYLRDFYTVCTKPSLEEITFKDLQEWYANLPSFGSLYIRNQNLSAVRCLLRYHKARGLNCLPGECIGALQKENAWYLENMQNKREKTGRPPLLGFAMEVQTMKEKRGISMRKIALEMERKYGRKFHVSQIHDWIHYPIS